MAELMIYSPKEFQMSTSYTCIDAYFNVVRAYIFVSVFVTLACIKTCLLFLQVILEQCIISCKHYSIIFFSKICELKDIKL